TDNAQRWRSARRWMQQAARAIGDDGTLPLEMARGGRALHYHAFAMMPLVVLAELAHARGENWYAFGDGALHRLVAVTTAGLVEPAVFDQAAGQRQERPVNARAGWATLYARRFPRRGIPPSLTRKRRHRLLGGDVRVLLAALRRDGRNDGAR
ncbi:MAG: alginate lyase family protein, partial [Pseudomonadota bacterium]